MSWMPRHYGRVAPEDGCVHGVDVRRAVGVVVDGDKTGQEVILRVSTAAKLQDGVSNHARDAKEELDQHSNPAAAIVLANWVDPVRDGGQLGWCRSRLGWWGGHARGSGKLLRRYRR